MIFYTNLCSIHRTRDELSSILLINLIIRLREGMKAAESYQLLRGQTNAKASLNVSRDELKAMVKQRQSVISQLSKTIEVRRTQMKQLSKQINLIIDKQAKRPQKQVPVFKPNHLSQPLQKYHDELDSIYRQCQHLKSQIRALKEEQPDQIVKESQKNQALINFHQRQILTITNNKQLLIQQLQQNKQRLQELRSNQCLKDFEERQHQYEQLIKQRKQYQKQITSIDAESLPLGRYYFQIKRRVEKEVIEEKVQTEIDIREIQTLVEEINEIVQERNSIEREAVAKIKDLKLGINQFEKQNKSIMAAIRQIHNQILRNQLEARRTFSFASQPSKKIQQPQQIEKKVNPEMKEKKKKIVNKVYMMQKDDQRTIVVGDWLPKGEIYSDRGQTWQIQVERVKKIIFLVENNELVGVRTVYSDKNGSSLEGRTFVSPQVFSYSELEVTLNQVLSIQYTSKNQSYLKFIGKKISKEIGKKAEDQPTQKISLEQYMIKWVEVQLNRFMIALRLSLQDRPPQEQTIEEQAPQSPTHQRSTSLLGPRRVILKGRSLSKLKKEQIIDHRLMLVKHKMV